jgi:hypothetical protein
MKKITLLLAALVVGMTSFAQVTITHNNSQTMVPDLGLTCATGQITTDNQFAQVFDLENDFGITEDWEVQQVEFGVEDMLNAEGDMYPVTVRVHTTDDGTPNGNLTLLGDGLINLQTADQMTVVSVDISPGAVVPAGGVLVVELEVFAGANGITEFRLGATDVASDDDSWILANDCGLATFATYADLGFNDRWQVMNVVGDVAVAGIDDISEYVSIYPNPASDVLNVQLPNTVEIISANLYDVLGKDTNLQLVNGTINTSNLSRGVYILNLKTDIGSVTQKIVKQ